MILLFMTKTLKLGRWLASAGPFFQPKKNMEVENWKGTQKKMLKPFICKLLFWIRMVHVSTEIKTEDYTQKFGALPNITDSDITTFGLWGVVTSLNGSPMTLHDRGAGGTSTREFRNSQFKVFPCNSQAIFRIRSKSYHDSSYEIQYVHYLPEISSWPRQLQLILILLLHR